MKSLGEGSSLSIRDLDEARDNTRMTELTLRVEP